MRILQTDDKGQTVADLGPPVPEDLPETSTNADVPDNNIEFYGQVAPAKIKRPSLEVETEVHARLVTRIEAHLRRIAAWDTRTLSSDQRNVLAVAIELTSQGFDALTEALKTLSSAGFVAKTTAASRKRAALKCAVGRAVRLSPEWHDRLVGLFYSSEELDTLTLAKVGDSSVLLVTAAGREIGPLPFAQVELVDG